MKEVIDEINKKMARLKMESEVFKISFDFAEELSNDKDMDFKQECSTANPEGENDLECDIIDSI